MSKIVAFDWDIESIRLVVGDLRGSRLRISALEEIPLPDEADESFAAARSRLQEFLRGLGSGSSAVGVVGRTQAILRDLKMPIVPLDELPSMVEFQAMRELSFPVEQASIDFDLLSTEGEQHHVVLAALQQEIIKRCKSVLDSAQIGLEKLGLRSHASWHAYRNVTSHAGEAALLLNMAGPTLELTIGRNDQVLFSRATRWTTTDEAQAAKVLCSEIRRTIAAFSNQVPGVEVKHIGLPATAGNHEQWIEAISESFGIPVQRIDPLVGAELAKGIDSSKADSGEFVAAIGAAIAANQSWKIDFVNVKKPTVKKDRRKPMAIGAAVAAAVMLGAMYFYAQAKVSEARDRTARLAQQQQLLDQSLEKAAEVMGRYRAVADWRSFETNALKELNRLTTEFPDTRKLHVTGLLLERSRNGEGKLTVDLNALDRSAAHQFQYKMKGNSVGSVREEKGAYGFTTSISLDPLPAPAPAKEAAETAEPLETTASDNQAGSET